MCFEGFDCISNDRLKEGFKYTANVLKALQNVFQMRYECYFKSVRFFFISNAF